MRALKFLTGHVIFKLRYNQIYQMKTIYATFKSRREKCGSRSCYVLSFCNFTMYLDIFYYSCDYKKGLDATKCKHYFAGYFLPNQFRVSPNVLGTKYIIDIQCFINVVDI